MKNAVALLAGFLFALGLGLSGMTSSTKVLAFLNLRGDWDPSLLFVMGAAVTVYAIGYRFTRDRAKPVLDKQFHVPQSREITPALLLGACFFGFGWGLAGYCPGPALVSLTTLTVRPLLFVGGMLLGMAIFHRLDRARPIHR